MNTYSALEIREFSAALDTRIIRSLKLRGHQCQKRGNDARFNAGESNDAEKEGEDPRETEYRSANSACGSHGDDKDG